MIDFYKSCGFDNVKVDLDNNSEPTKILESTTHNVKHNSKKNYSVSTLINYQTSHIFGKTKNIYCFTAPWNICFVPKIIDPLTGHEAKGGFPESFKKRWMKKVKKKYKNYIGEYNELVADFDIDSKLKTFFDSPEYSSKHSLNKKRFIKDMKEQFSPIE